MAPHPDLAEASISDLRRRLDGGELSVRRLAEMHLERIEAIDQVGPSLRSVIEVNPDWEEIAGRLDPQRADGRDRGPLHGIPVFIKDNIDTGDRMLTTAGSFALTGAPAPADAPLVARLRAAGMLVLGKTNLSECLPDTAVGRLMSVIEVLLTGWRTCTRMASWRTLSAPFRSRSSRLEQGFF